MQMDRHLLQMDRHLRWTVLDLQITLVLADLAGIPWQRVSGGPGRRTTLRLLNVLLGACCQGSSTIPAPSVSLEHKG